MGKRITGYVILILIALCFFDALHLAKANNISTDTPLSDIQMPQDHNRLTSEQIDSKTEILQLKDWYLYPNPTSGVVNINFTLETQEGVTVRVLDILGNKVYEEKIYGDHNLFEKEVDLSENHQGLYFLQVLYKNKSLTRKIIIE